MWPANILAKRGMTSMKHPPLGAPRYSDRWFSSMKGIHVQILLWSCAVPHDV